MKVLERNRAVELRKQGKTLSEILKEIPVSKSSLSYWLRGIELTQEQMVRIKYKNDKIKERFIKFNELKKKQADNNKKIIFNNAFNGISNISTEELKLIGIALYWAEGYKGAAYKGAEFTNSDPSMIKLMMRWFRETCGVQESKFRIRIQLHNTRNTEMIKGYWSEVTSIPLAQFTKPYIKISPTSKRKMGNLIPYGTCNIRVSDINLITRIRGWINGLMALSSSPV